MEFRKQCVLSGALAAVIGFGAAGAVQALEPADLTELRDKTVTMLDEQGEEAAIETLGDPDAGVLDLEGAGLHSWGMTTEGLVIWDHSGQAAAGMDISGFEGPSGLNYVEDVVAQVREGDGEMEWESFPHPTTNAVGTASLSCEEFETDRYVCVMAWL